MSPLVEEALRSLTSRVNLSTGLSNYSDESAAKEIFKLLHKEGESLVAGEITQWAMSNRWKVEDATELGELAQRIGQGGKVVIRNKGMWRADIIEQFKGRIGATKI